MPNLVREPLLHFVVVALLLFIVFPQLSDDTEEERLIRVSAAEIERLMSLYELETGTAPDAESLHHLVSKHVRQAALAKEARSLGLDDGDIIIERRLAQKMLFMVSDIAKDTVPDEQLLLDWYNKHRDRFHIPANMTFEHVYYSKAASDYFKTTLYQLNQKNPIDWKTLGEPFMLQRQYGHLPQREAVRIFGADFSESLFKVEVVDKWVGPLRSALGFHLVRVREFNKSVMPLFEDVRDEVEADWQDAARRQQNDRAVANIVAQYKVEIEGLAE